MGRTKFVRSITPAGDLGAFSTGFFAALPPQIAAQSEASVEIRD